MSKPLSYFSVCSGVEAATSALHPLGFLPMGFAEIDKAASRVLAFHHGSNMPGLPLSRNGVPNFGDLTTINPEDVPPVDWLIGGTPCQGFSVAGARGSLKDARSNLALAYVVLAHELVRSCGLKGCLWENVPGVLSTDDNAFGCFLGGLIGADDALLPCPKPPDGRTNDFWNWKQDKDTDRWFHAPTWPSAGMAAGPRARLAWRILDAQHFGLAQRRARVFVIADFGDGPDPAKVLFEPKSMHRDTPKSQGARQGIAGTLSARTEGGGGLGTDFDLDGGLQPVSVLAHGQGGAEIGIDQWPTLNCNHEQPILIAPPLTSNPYGDHESREGLLVTEAFTFKPSHFTRGKDGAPDRLAPPLSADADKGDQDAVICAPVAFNSKQGGEDALADMSPTLRAMGHKDSHANGGGQIAVAFNYKASASQSMNPSEISPTLDIGKSDGVCVAFQDRFRGDDGRGYDRPPAVSEEQTGALETVKPWNVAVEEPYTLAIRGRGDSHDLEYRQDGTANALLTPNGGRAGIGVGAIAIQWAVRRLTPRECERLQGFPDDYTAIPGAADGPRYKQLGNSFAVNVIAWIGARILAASEG